MTSGHRRRTYIALTWLVLLTSCARGVEKLDLTLRSRDGFARTTTGCEFWAEHPHPTKLYIERHEATTTECEGTEAARQWVGSDGRRASSAGASGPAFFSSYLISHVVCNGQALRLGQSWFRWRIPGNTLDVQFDDGSTVTLHDEQAIAVFNDAEVGCSEGSGQWRGTAGSLVGRAGTYTMVYDSTQTVLHLVED